MKKKAGIVLPVLIVLIIAGVVFWREMAGRNGPADGTLSGNGTVEATEVEISSKVAGRLQSLEVREGDSVTRDQLIAILDSGDLEGQVDQAQGNLAATEAALRELLAGTRSEEINRIRAQAEAAQDALRQVQARRDLVAAGARPEQLDQIKAALRQAEVGLADAETEFRRAQKLEGEGALPGRDLDQARTKRDLAQAQVEAAGKRLAEAEAGARPEELREVEAAAALAGSQVKAAQASLDLALAGPRRETIEAARARVEQARGALRTARYLLEQTRITAPSDGRVTLRNSEPGEIITPGFPIVKLAYLKQVWLRVYVPETQVGLVKLGQRAEVASDTYPGRKYRGQVTEIAEKPEFTPKNVQTKEERVKLVFGVKVEVDNPDQELKPGMPADAVIFL